MFKLLLRLIGVFVLILFLRSWIASNQNVQEADNSNPTSIPEENQEKPPSTKQRYDANDQNYIAEGLNQAPHPLQALDSIADRYKRYALYIEATKNAPCNTHKKAIKHLQQKWSSDDKKYTADFVASPTQGCRAEALREKLKISSFDHEYYWGNIYATLARNDLERLNLVYKTFAEIQKKYKLNYEEFAKMIISFVQYQPYVLVHPGSCRNDRKRNDFSRHYHDNNKVCLPYKRFGLQAPSEFMYNLQGDCDTRALFLYTVLSHFGYDVVVLGSQRHAMLGINLPAQGHYLIYKGRKYYFWETTGTGWVIGAIPPIYQGDNWEITLHSLKLDV